MGERGGVRERGNGEGAGGDRGCVCEETREGGRERKRERAKAREKEGATLETTQGLIHGFQSTPIQMLPSGGSICASLT